MWKIILIFIVLIFSLLGLAELLHRIWMGILKPKTLARSFLVVLLEDANACEQLVYAAEHLRWCGRECAEGVIAVDCGLDAELLDRCSQFSGADNEVKIYSLNKLSDIIKKTYY